ncbi:serine/arginine repetitive matrix protein 2-like, partial [Acipenser oxyrinchus oxyrinchus]
MYNGIGLVTPEGVAPMATLQQPVHRASPQGPAGRQDRRGAGQTGEQPDQSPQPRDTGAREEEGAGAEVCAATGHDGGAGV